MSSRRLLLNAFVCASPGHVKPGLWPYALPGNELADFDDLDLWVRLAATLERGRFDGLFIGDVLGLYAPYRGSWDVYLEDGNRFPMLDSLTLASALATATHELGLIFTASVIQDHPYTLARRIATLDHFTGGRVGWNIVTSSTENAHRNYGAEGITPHDERYVWAREHVQVVLKLLEGSWDPGAVLRDGETRRFADPALVHRIDHEGQRYKVQGPLIVHPSPQRSPVLFQAGSSPAGTDFAAEFGEGALLLSSLDAAAGTVRALREKALAKGRKAGDVKVFAALTPVLASTSAEARAKREHFDELLNSEALAAEVGGNVGIDLSALEPDDPIDYSAAQGGLGKILAEAAKHPDGIVTKRQYLRAITGDTTIVGTPEEVADVLGRWQESGGDGVNFMNYLIPGTYDDIVDHLIPVLRQRGLAQHEYVPGTLREKLFGAGPHLNERHPASRYRNGPAGNL